MFPLFTASVLCVLAAFAIPLVFSIFGPRKDRPR
jgi:membrane protein CcdC involved in cytochrome C biogenesis